MRTAVVECSHPEKMRRVIWQAMDSSDVTSNECLSCMFVWVTPYE